MSAYVIDSDAFYPRNEEERYRLYLRRGRALDVLATCGSPEAVGTAVFALDADEREAGRRGLVDRGVVGVLDAVERRWVLLPWQRGERTEVPA